LQFGSSKKTDFEETYLDFIAIMPFGVYVAMLPGLILSNRIFFWPFEVAAP
jgi:hypothetical protein